MTYSRSSRERPPRDFRKVVATRAGRLREWALVRPRKRPCDKTIESGRLQELSAYVSRWLLIVL